MIRFRRGRFHDLVARQLDLFASDERDLLEDAEAAEEAWNRASREDAEELYGDWQLVLEALGERLLDLRETYAATLAEKGAEDYRAAFMRAASARYRKLTALLD
jgi:hypothetical protein